jgi:hypothetical protein
MAAMAVQDQGKATGPAAPPAERAKAAAAILLPLSVPMGLLLILALTLDGGEVAFAALSGQQALPAPEIMASPPLVATPANPGHARLARGPSLMRDAMPAMRMAPRATTPQAEAVWDGAAREPVIWPAVMSLPPAMEMAVTGPGSGVTFTMQTGYVPALAGTFRSYDDPDTLSLLPAVFLPPPKVTAPAALQGPIPYDETTAVGVRMILEPVRDNWIQLIESDDVEWVHFSILAAFRCGMTGLRYGLNGAPANQVLALEPCHLDSDYPNEMRDMQAFLPAVRAPLGFVDSIAVTILYDDGTLDEQIYQRQDVLERP